MSDDTLSIELPPDVRRAVERLTAYARAVFATAAAEKVGVLTDAKAYFAERAAGADLEWFDRFIARKGGEPPTPEDQVAER